MLAVVSAIVLSLSSPAFPTGSPIPQRYTCDGADRSPPLRWSHGPARTRSFAIEVDDPDAPGGVFVHWTLWNLASTARRVPAGFAWRLQGRNSFGRIGYSGPCPPKGAKHHYLFTLWAVDRRLSLQRGTTPGQLHRAVAAHVLRVATLVGTYHR